MNPALLETRLKLMAIRDRYLGPSKPGGKFYNKRRRVTELYQAASPFKKRCEQEPLPGLDPKDHTRQNFLELSQDFSRPVVLRGFLNDTRAVQLWTKEYLENLAGDREYNVVQLQGEGENTTVGHVKVKFSDFLAGMNENRWYLNNSTDLVHQNPELLEDFDAQRIQDFFKGEVVATQLFIGGDSVWSGLHCAFNGNFFANIAGRKEWILTSPKYTHYLMPLFSKPFIFSKSGYDLKNEPPDSFVFHLPRYRVLLEPGDLLYIAPWWWHEVQNYTPFTIAFAVRYDAHLNLDIKNNRLFTLMSLLPFTRMLNLVMKMKSKLAGKEYSRMQAGNAFFANRVGKGRAAVKRFKKSA